MRRLMLPLACYLGVTLGMPLLDGNAGSGFAEHVVLVGAGCLLALFPWFMRALARDRASRRQSPPPPRSAATSTA